MFPGFNVLARILTEKYYILSEERLLGLRNQRARDRYAFLIRHHPEIILRAASQHIASYLGIDKATLSRLKSPIGNLHQGKVDSFLLTNPEIRYSSQV